MRWWSIVSWQRVRRERSAANPRMDVDWDELVDGRVRLLRVGRDYEAEVGEVEQAASAAAASRGMVARTAFEKVPRMRYFESYVWVQFADGEIDSGGPCIRCGEPNPVTIHPSFARCPSCGARLLLKRPKGSKKGRPVMSGEGNGRELRVDRAHGDAAATPEPAEEAVRPQKASNRPGRKKGKPRRGQKERGLKGKGRPTKSRRAPDL
jgi:DNA-directed RNA polymerase subunit RPC12/RpoP